jgi:hypothetical protein
VGEGEHANCDLIRGLYWIADGRVVEAWFFPEDPAASDAFFEGGIDG